MIVEGSTKIFARGGTPRGPEARNPEHAFFNPAMETNRDLSVLLATAYAKQRGRGIDFADVLAGTGARSLRLANEVDADIQVHANDADPKAGAAIQKGAEENGVGDQLSFRHGDAHQFLASQRFDIVDVDPYGSPMPFLDGAVRATRHNGLVCLTATDTAALCGTYPRVCRRRYGAHHGLRDAPWKAEVGLRILAGTAITAAGRYDRAATPMLSVFGGHWMRVVLRVEDGRSKADRQMKQLDWAWNDDGMGRFSPPANAARAGPLWTGQLHDETMVSAMSELENSVCDATRTLLGRMHEETDAPAFWFDLGDVRARLGRDAPRRDRLMASLSDAGYQATRTHLSPDGIRSDATLAQLATHWP